MLLAWGEDEGEGLTVPGHPDGQFAAKATPTAASAFSFWTAGGGPRCLLVGLE
jgi:hypothetical protein